MNNLDEYIVEMEKEMGGNKWWVEDNVKNRAGAPKNAELGQPLVLTDQDYSLRPYAVLDYILTPVTPVIYLRCVSYNEDCVIFLSIKTDSTPYSRLIWRKTRATISLNDASDNIYKEIGALQSPNTRATIICTRTRPVLDRCGVADERINPKWSTSS
jgi:hypothetical protein